MLAERSRLGRHRNTRETQQSEKTNERPAHRLAAFLFGPGLPGSSSGHCWFDGMADGVLRSRGVIHNNITLTVACVRGARGVPLSGQWPLSCKPEKAVGE